MRGRDVTSGKGNKLESLRSDMVVSTFLLMICNAFGFHRILPQIQTITSKTMLRKLSNLLILFTLFSLMFAAPLLGQIETEISNINSNPANFVNENVIIEGLVTQFVPSTSTTVAYYVLRDEFGSEIQVNTTIGPPNTNEKYRVTGVVYHENRNIFVSETSRESLETPLLLYFIIGASLLLLVVILFLLFSKNQPAPAPAPSPSLKSQPQADPSASSSEDEFFQAGGENTIVIEREYMTMKALPGKLVILTGDQADKKLSLFGANTPDGTVITIGRNSPDWKKQLKKGRENAHIRIEDSTNTVSRLQAELIYANGEMKLKNLAKANPTLVDANELGVGEKIVLNNGSIIQAGNVKMRYEA